MVNKLKYPKWDLPKWMYSQQMLDEENDRQKATR